MRRGIRSAAASRDTTPEAFDRLFEVNVKAPLFMMQEAAKHMVPAKSGVIINVASMLAHGGRPNLATYSASKVSADDLVAECGEHL